MIERVKPHRHWKDIRYNRKESGQNFMDDSSEQSVQSNNSIRFSKFKAKKEEFGESSLKRSPSRTSRIFQKSRKHIEQRDSFNILSKKNMNETQQKSQKESKKSEYQINLNGMGKVQGAGVEANARKNKIKQMQLKRITTEIKYMIGELKKNIQLFNSKYIDLKSQWQKSFKKLLTKFINIEHTEIHKNIQLFQDKMQQIQNIKKPLDQYIGSSNISPQTMKYFNSESFNHLNLSKIDREPSEQKVLSRNNTITSILAQENQQRSTNSTSSPIKTYFINRTISMGDQYVKKDNEMTCPMRHNVSQMDMSNMNGAIRRMKEILER